MKQITCFPFWLLVLIPLLMSFAHNSAQALDGADATHVHVLVVADTNDAAIGPHVDADRGNIVTSLEKGIPEVRRSITVLTGNRVSPDAVLDQLRKINVTRSDTLVFYYAGHGSWDERYGHVLTMAAGGLSRRTLMEAMSDKRARLTVILTDCCSVYSTLGNVPKVHGPDPDVLRYLFFRHQGFVDINSSRKGTYAFGDANGGIFSNALKECLYLPLSALDANRDQMVEWREFAGALDQKTRSKFQVLVARDQRIGAVAANGQSGQTPEIFGVLARLVGGPIARTR